MEIEVSLKVRSAIKAKLLELGVHVDEELPDYVMVLVANRRTKSQMDSDLSLFLGENTIKFTTWLVHVLKKLEQVTLATHPPPQPSKQTVATTVDTQVVPVPPTAELTIQQQQQSSKTSSKRKKGNSGSSSSGSAPPVINSTDAASSGRVAFKLKRPLPGKQPSASTIVQVKEGLNNTTQPNIKSDAVILRAEPDSSSSGTAGVESSSSSVITSTTKATTALTLSKVESEVTAELVLGLDEPDEFESVPEEPDLEQLRQIALDTTTANKSSVKNSTSSPSSPLKGSRVMSLSKTSAALQIVKSIIVEESSKEKKKKMDEETSRKRKREKSPLSSRRLRSTVTKAFDGRSERAQEEYDPAEPTIKSLVCVTARPRRDHEPSKNLIFKAMRDAEMDTVRRYTPAEGITTATNSTRRSSRSSRERVEERSRVHRRSEEDVEYRRSRSRERRSRRDSRSRSHRGGENRRSPLPLPLVSRNNSSGSRRKPLKEESPVSRKYTHESNKLLTVLQPEKKKMSIKERLGERIRGYHVRMTEEKLLGSGVKVGGSVVGGGGRKWVDPDEEEYVEEYTLEEEEIPDEDDDDDDGIIMDDDLERASSCHFYDDGNKKEFTLLVNVPNSDPKREQQNNKDTTTTRKHKLTSVDTSKQSHRSVLIGEGYGDVSSCQVPGGGGVKKSRLSIQVNVDSESESEEDEAPPPSTQPQPQLESQEPKKTDRLADLRAKLATLTKSSNQGSNIVQTKSNTTEATSKVDQEEEVKVPAGRVSPPKLPFIPFIPLSSVSSNTTTICKYWPSCSFSDSCKYKHPLCKYGVDCSKSGCLYKHMNNVGVSSSRENLVGSIGSRLKKVGSAVVGLKKFGGSMVKCSWFPSCHNMNCSYFHPKVCRFGSSCNDPACQHWHPGNSNNVENNSTITTTNSNKNKYQMAKTQQLPSVHQLKWTSSSTTK